MSAKSKKSFLDRLKFWDRSKPKKQAVKSDDDGEANPRITSDTVAEHREEILSGARRFIYPLQHSRKRVVMISSLIIAGVLIGSVVFSSLLLYRYQSTSNFAYRVSQILPYPISKVDGSYVAYENYLFELSYSLFYYNNYNQEGVDIDSSEGEQLVAELKSQALEKVKLDAIAQQLADRNGIEVSEEQIDRQIELIQNNGGIGDSEQALEEILRSSYNWDVNDLRRTIRLQLLRQSLPRLLDEQTITDADAAKAELEGGAEFGATALKYSDDALTKEANGVIGLISRTDTALPPEFIEAAFSLEEGETSEIVESRFGLHIIRINSVEGDEREVAHVLFQYFDIDQFLRDELEKVDVVDYISVN